MNTKWWWHELALVQEIGLEGTQNATPRELLPSVVSDAESTSPSSFACEKQLYGAKETFSTAPAVQATKATVNRQPRYFLVGQRRGPNERITMQQQNTLLNAIQGNKGARIKDADVIKRRQAGWKDWGEQRWSTEALAFEQKELPAIQNAFYVLFDNADDRGSVANELRTVLLQSNLIKSNNTPTETPAVTPVATRTVARSVTRSESTSSVDDVDDATPPPTKRPRVGRPSAITHATDNDPWLLDTLRALTSRSFRGFKQLQRTQRPHIWLSSRRF